MASLKDRTGATIFEGTIDLAASGVDSIAKAGDAALTGPVTLSEGANVTLTQTGQDIQIASSGGGGGGEMDYAEITADVPVAGSSGAPTAIISGAAVNYDGATRVKIEFFTPLLAPGNQALIVEFYDGASSLGRVGQIGPNLSAPGKCEQFVTPAAGAHTFHVKAWKNGGTDGIIGALPPFAPAFLRITKA